MLACGCIPALVALAGSGEGELRLNGVWALQNLVFNAGSDVRRAVMAALPWAQALALTNDIRSDVQVGSAFVDVIHELQSASPCPALGPSECWWALPNTLCWLVRRVAGLWLSLLHCLHLKQ